MRPGRFVRVLFGALALTTLVAACDMRVRVRDPQEPKRNPWTGKVEACKNPGDPGCAPAGPALASEPPVLGEPKAFEPPAPIAFQTAGGIRVLLLERREVPLVSATFVVGTGAASDPVDKPGLASLTFDMMDEGAGTRDALALSNAVLDLGATLSTAASYDGGFAAVSSLKSKFPEAFSILCDVVARPKLGPKDYGRVMGLWKNALKKRGDEPTAVASLVANRLLYGAEAPYGHPASGTLTAADRMTLDDVKRFYATHVTPEDLTLVVVGQITRPEIEALLEKNLASMKPRPKDAPPLVLPGTKQTVKPRAERPQIAVVDKKDAVQTVILVAGEGTRVADEDAPLASLVNVALGGSFTSRLNQNLREAKGWTYGVRSGFSEVRGNGLFTVRTSVETPVTGKAVAEIMRELRAFADKGLTPEEFTKIRAQDRADLVEMYETTASTASRYASLSSLGLPPSRDAAASRLRQRATLPELNAVAKRRFDPDGATIVVVGDRKAITEQLAEVGLTNLAFFDSEGKSLDPAVPKDKPAAPKEKPATPPKKPEAQKPAEKKPGTPPPAKPTEKKPPTGSTPPERKPASTAKPATPPAPAPPPKK